MPHKLKNLLTSVPSDLEIAQAATPLRIEQIASEAGILPDELRRDVDDCEVRNRNTHETISMIGEQRVRQDCIPLRAVA